VTESKRRHRRRRAAAVLRVPRARIRDPRQDPGNHARWPRWRTRSEAPAPCDWPGLSIPVPSVPRPSPCAELGAGRAAAAPGIHYLKHSENCSNSGPKSTSICLGNRRKQIGKSHFYIRSPISLFAIRYLLHRKERSNEDLSWRIVPEASLRRSSAFRTSPIAASTPPG